MRLAVGADVLIGQEKLEQEWQESKIVDTATSRAFRLTYNFERVELTAAVWYRVPVLATGDVHVNFWLKQPHKPREALTEPTDSWPLCLEDAEGDDVPLRLANPQTP
jgi:hypothetical protein